jgi:GT2 family glycosyltransferase
VLVLNPDTLVQEDTLRALVAFMDAHPEAGAAGCQILNPDGSFAPESRRAFPTPSVALFRLTGLSRLFPRSPVFGRYNLTFLPRDRECEVDALSGSCMMVRAAAIHGDGRRAGAGLLDEDFFMYGEDLDWCFRIQQAGWRIYYTPATQIIHYKGESTKKGELRYVRLFYGAMLRFAEKHFRPEVAGRPFRRFSLRALSVGLHAAILARGAASAAFRVARWVAAPVLDLLLATGAFAAGGVIGGETVARALPEASVAAAVVVLGVMASGGYARRQRGALRPALIGLFGALVAGLTLAFVAPGLAPGRWAMVFGGALATLALIARRRATRRGTRRAVVVGSGAEADRLLRLVADRPRPAVHVVGHVDDAQGGPPTVTRLLGPPRQLRDLVRLHDVHEVVFAAESLSNTTILGHMRRLADLPVQLKILAAGHDRVIGKASVEDFSLPLRAAEDAVAPVRPSPARRAFATLVAGLGTALYPLLRGLARARPTPRTRRLADVASRMPAVLKGRLSLVGFAPGDHRPPPEWGLTAGAVSVLDALPARPAEITEAQRAYWFYVRHPSVALDAEVLFRSLARAE